VVPIDFDGDGDFDLFVGGRLQPFYYGVPADSYLLQNDGSGVFTRISDTRTSALNQLGLVTDATLADINGDDNEELIVVGRWMPIKVFKLSNSGVKDISGDWVPQKSNGWYNTIEAEDLNGDGRIDLIVGNHGLNSRFNATQDEPVSLLVNDFDNSGTYEQVISMYTRGKEFPFVQLKELAAQLPQVAQRYQSFNDYKDDQTDVIFPEELQKQGFVLQAYNLASGILINQGKNFKFKPLPARAQFSPVYAITTGDFNQDGFMDIITGGNFSQSKPEVGTYAAGFGSLFIGSEAMSFDFVPNEIAGFSIPGDIRDIMEINVGDKNVLVFTRNNHSIYSVQHVTP
jgi:hypothetical protein